MPLLREFKVAEKVNQLYAVLYKTRLLFYNESVAQHKKAEYCQISASILMYLLYFIHIFLWKTSDLEDL